MSRRDLTHNDPARGPPAYNPFEEQPSDDDLDFINSQSNLAMHSQDYGHGSNSQALYRDSLESGVPRTPRDSMGQIQQQLTGTSSPSSNVLVGPSSFDRYPQMLHAREYSSGSLASNFAQQQRPSRQSPSDSPGSSTQNLIDPFSPNAELSPFGGYPASQFPLHIDEKEEDDFLHNPDPIADAAYDKNRFLYDMKHMDRRSFFGLVGYVLIFLAAAAVFIVLPVVTYSGSASQSKPESYEVLTQFSYPLSSAIRTSLIDPDTPSANLTKTTRTGEEWVLTFSDEFNAEGRTFYDGDDQFFQAVDIHYDATKDLEWYDPDAVTTANGTLVLRMDAIQNHNLFYRSGMVQSWNKLCFSQGMIVVSALLPGYGNISGLWPGLWTLGNLGRPGYLGTTEGVWPYTYDSCDSGITANQSSPDGISYLPGQKLNVCTCPGESHPNTGVGRGSPEIDIVEGSVDSILKVGVVSQSYQVAPMDIWYMPDYNFVEIYNHEVTAMNTYAGGPFQQAVSILSTLNTTWYTDGDYSGNFQDYGFEYLNDNDDGYITWYVGQDPVVTVNAYALGPNGNIGFRRISKEPMSLIMNLGISNNWAYIDWPALRFPLSMRVDYVRIYQPADSISMTCDPEGYPTTEYISNHGNVYNNVNLTSWEDAGYTYPKNRLVHGC